MINKSYEIGVRKLVIITGKGIHSDNEKNPYVSKEFGKLKYSVPDYIKKNDQLMNKITNIEDADIEDGGINTGSAAGIRGVPTVIIYKKGIEVDRKVGGVPEGHMKEFLEKNI